VIPRRSENMPRPLTGSSLPRYQRVIGQNMRALNSIELSVGSWDGVRTAASRSVTP
jgi:hypothetical protein